MEPQCFGPERVFQENPLSFVATSPTSTNVWNSFPSILSSQQNWFLPVCLTSNTVSMNFGKVRLFSIVPLSRSGHQPRGFSEWRFGLRGFLVSRRPLNHSWARDSTDILMGEDELI